MCPACIANAALMAGSVMSTGGIAAFAVTMVRGKKSRSEKSMNETERRNDNGNNERSNQPNPD
jgi:hypothetical protein